EAAEVCLYDGAPHHFNNNKGILNLTDRETDFEIPASRSFNAAGHGKGAVDGIGATVKYRATRKVWRGTEADVILKPPDLYKLYLSTREWGGESMICCQ
ncbi:unnamed protein product, partial [Didymodactylos carnosus]